MNVPPCYMGLLCLFGQMFVNPRGLMAKSYSPAAWRSGLEDCSTQGFLSDPT